jgi:hypothetical protein
MPPDKGLKRQKTINDALDKLADTLTDSESENEEIVGLADQSIDPIVLDDELEPPPISKRKRGPGKKKGNSPFKSSGILY